MIGPVVVLPARPALKMPATSVAASARLETVTSSMMESLDRAAKEWRPIAASSLV